MPPPLQHGSPAAPHFIQALGPIAPDETQPRPLSHDEAPNPPPQHGSPAAPHFMHALAAPEETQPRPLSHCDWPWQHACPLPPQVSHIPGVAGVGVPEAPPLLPVVMPTQAPPGWQAPPAQHSVPAAPQLVHMVTLPDMTAQPRPVEQVRPLQHGCPLPPQVSHIPTLPAPASAPAVWQASPAPQLLLPPPQQI